MHKIYVLHYYTDKFRYHGKMHCKRTRAEGNCQIQSVHNLHKYAGEGQCGRRQYFIGHGESAHCPQKPHCKLPTMTVEYDIEDRKADSNLHKCEDYCSRGST